MKNLKRAASLGLCAVTVLSQMNIQAFAADTTNTAYADGTYIAETHFMKSSDINTASMCDSLFYDYATAEVKGEDTTLTFYVVDPIPAFSSAGQPLTEVKFTVDGTDYEASIDSDNKETKSFGTGFGFTSAGDYECDVITVTVPTKAVENDEDGALYCTAYVNAVMSTYQYFYMILDMDNAQFTPAETTDDSKEEYVEAQGEQKEINAYKSGTTDKSSMANYLYNNVIVADTENGHSVTLYANAGELGYVKYNDAEAKKYDNAKTIDGVTYDAFVISVSEVADVMNLTVYVNQMAAINPNFAVQSFDLSFVKEDVKDDDTTKKEEQSVVITASVAEEEAEYYVTIPASISLGELSRDTDTVVSYDVVVDVKSMPENGSVKVSAPENGSLNSGSNVIAFANSFGTVSYTESATTTADISVKADDVKVKGDYQGTTVFNIEYSEAE